MSKAQRRPLVIFLQFRPGERRLQTDSVVGDLRPVRCGALIPCMLFRFLQPRMEAAFALLRVVVGALFAFHGCQKIFGLLSNSQPPPGSQLWIGGLIELTTGTAICLGLFTSWAAFLASGTMAVAYVQFHWKLSFGERFFPAINQGELALVYSLLFLYMACRGPGPWSIDQTLFSGAPSVRKKSS